MLMMTMSRRARALREIGRFFGGGCGPPAYSTGWLARGVDDGDGPRWWCAVVVVAVVVDSSIQLIKSWLRTLRTSLC